MGAGWHRKTANGPAKPGPGLVYGTIRICVAGCEKLRDTKRVRSENTSCPRQGSRKGAKGKEHETNEEAVKEATND
ncbi:uncharacterized protein SPSK_05765 [Sporothrix schenckii 1099-18]|uniref:Uncharacterized protein n=1 Tax=Sporothrix schenckii 1099-18 TaxID=1397361 RepID=A0A0F2LUA2_SPOSC|nr:uncharacterized protein SPSK_05765 [Sporothrix schenckii 1099-18]KJR81053.1 hypothetical protein SPSK_05765 [Sporothrix schenckii 1099-18]